MKLVYPIRTGVFQKWISIAVKSFDTGLGINKLLLFLNFLYNLLKYAGMAYLLFNNYSFNRMLSKAIMEKCWLRILNLHKLFTYTWWRSTKVMKLESILPWGPGFSSVYTRGIIQKCLTQNFSALAYCNPLMRIRTCVYQGVTVMFKSFALHNFSISPDCFHTFW